MIASAWYSPQTANHLIWAVALVTLALIALVALVVWTQHRRELFYAENAAKLAADERKREEQRGA